MDEPLDECGGAGDWPSDRRMQRGGLFSLFAGEPEAAEFLEELRDQARIAPDWWPTSETD